jgi:hypothetical protein
LWSALAVLVALAALLWAQRAILALLAVIRPSSLGEQLVETLVQAGQLAPQPEERLVSA